MLAIIFDFFGTLTDPAVETGRRAAFAATAARLGIPADDFYRAMSDSFAERSTGRHGGTRATLREMARRCGAEPADDQLDAALAVHLAGAELVRRPRPGLESLLAELRRRGFRLGVLSDCSSELAEG